MYRSPPSGACPSAGSFDNQVASGIEPTGVSAFGACGVDEAERVGRNTGRLVAPHLDSDIKVGIVASDHGIGVGDNDPDVCRCCQATPSERL